MRGNKESLSTVQDEIAEEAGDDDDPAPASIRRKRDVLLLLLLPEVESRAGADPHHHRPAPSVLSSAFLLHLTAGLESRAVSWSGWAGLGWRYKMTAKNKVSCDHSVRLD